MRKINILERGFQTRHPHERLRQALLPAIWFPVVNAKWELFDLGIDVEFHKTVTDKLFDCDVLILSSRTVECLSKGAGNDHSDRARFCAEMGGRGPSLVWFDGRDSAGNCQFDVLPYVDRYIKRSMYRDLSLYEKRYLLGRIYTDWYIRNYGLDEDQQIVPHA